MTEMREIARWSIAGTLAGNFKKMENVWLEVEDDVWHLCSSLKG